MVDDQSKDNDNINVDAKDKDNIVTTMILVITKRI